MSVAYGSCLCGAVRFRLDPAPTQVWFCHCTQCRKAQGTAFASSVPIPLAHFTLLSGQDCLREFRATPAKARCFCAHCGSPVYSKVEGSATLRVRAGLLEADVALTPAGHIYVADRAPWHSIGDHCPQYPAREPGR